MHIAKLASSLSGMPAVSSLAGTSCDLKTARRGTSGTSRANVGKQKVLLSPCIMSCGCQIKLSQVKLGFFLRSRPNMAVSMWLTAWWRRNTTGAGLYICTNFEPFRIQGGDVGVKFQGKVT